MPSSKKDKNPQGIEINFNERWHKYTTPLADGNKVEYTSVTSLVHQFATPFDAPVQAAKVAERDGKKVDDVLKEWDEKRKYSCDFGTRIHETCEDVLLDAKKFRNAFGDDNEKAVAANAISTAKRIKSSMDVIAIEKIVFDVEDQIAGTIDLCAKDKKGVLWIMDWKTNATIDKYSKYRNKMLDPLSSLQDCNFNHYALQLSFYEHIMKKCGYIPKDLKLKRAIIHLTSEGFDFIHTPDYSEYVESIIAVHKAKLEEDSEIPF